jgi:hypothetical protein
MEWTSVITERQVRDAAFWEDTICPNCGTTGGETRYACFHCDSAEPLPAKQILYILENVEREDDGREDD